MAVTRKQDDGNNKKEQGKKEAGQKGNTGKSFVLNKDKKDGKNIPGQKPEKKEAVKKDIALVKDKKEVAKKDPKKDQPAKKEKVNYIELVQKFVKGAYSELKKVNWPGRRELIIYTAVVVVAVLFVGSLIWLFDSALSTVLRYVINR
ncbi:preprotein translocase subunit SecE [Pelotomaculum propionicicum]|uniref:preprotein translocase subunit SecE n=1 Tax=Pelotomaculum propionicicum TaxID=258475 RepID=UPI003B76A3A3